MHHKQLNVTMRGALEGITKIFHKKYSFVDGKFSIVASPLECDNLSRFFSASYNCEITITMPGEAPVVEGVEVPETVVETVVEDAPMTERQEKILEAVGAVDEEDWIQDVVPHPSLATLAGLMEDSTITKEEVIEVIENFMEDAEVPTEDDLEEAMAEPVNEALMESDPEYVEKLTKTTDEDATPEADTGEKE